MVTRLRMAVRALLLLTPVALAGCGSGGEPAGEAAAPVASMGADGAQEVRVEMGEFYFKPQTTTFKAGQKYRFVLGNVGTSPHEFTIAPPRKEGQDEEDLDAMSLIDVDQLKAGETRPVDFTFKDAAPAGTLEFECSYPGHYENGMKVAIVVEQ